MNSKMTVKQIVESKLTDEQVRDLWYDWFCKDESLVRRGRILIAKLQAIAGSRRINQHNYVFFKNNCPLHGRTYDSFSICDQATGDVVFWITPRLGYDASSGEAEMCQFKTYDARMELVAHEQKVMGSWLDVKKFFKSTDAEWAVYQASLPKPKFTVGTVVALFGSYGGEVKKDIVDKVGDMSFTLKGLGDHVAFKLKTGEQIVHSRKVRARRVEVWQEWHDKKVADENARKERDELRKRIEGVRNFLYSVQYSTKGIDATALDQIETILGIQKKENAA